MRKGRSSDHCCRGKVRNTVLHISVCARALVDLLNQHAKRIHRTVICGISSSIIFFDIIKKVIEPKMCFNLLYKVYLKLFSF